MKTAKIKSVAAPIANYLYISVVDNI